MVRHFRELLVAPPAHRDSRAGMDANQKRAGRYSPIAEECFSRRKLTPCQSEATQAPVWLLASGIQQMQPDVRAMRPRQVRGYAIRQQKTSAAEAIADPASRPAQPEQKIVTHVHPAGNCPIELSFPYPDDRTYKRNPMHRKGVVLLPSRKMLRPGHAHRNELVHQPLPFQKRLQTLVHQQRDLRPREPRSKIPQEGHKDG